MFSHKKRKVSVIVNINVTADVLPAAVPCSKFMKGGTCDGASVLFLEELLVCLTPISDPAFIYMHCISCSSYCPTVVTFVCVYVCVCACVGWGSLWFPSQ